MAKEKHNLRDLVGGDWSIRPSWKESYEGGRTSFKLTVDIPRKNIMGPIDFDGQLDRGADLGKLVEKTGVGMNGPGGLSIRRGRYQFGPSKKLAAWRFDGYLTDPPEEPPFLPDSRKDWYELEHQPMSNLFRYKERITLRGKLWHSESVEAVGKLVAGIKEYVETQTRSRGPPRVLGRLYESLRDLS